MGRPKLVLLLLVTGLVLFVTPQVPAQQAPRPAGPRPNAPQPQVIARPQAPAAARLPKGFPLDPQQQARVDQILQYWEHHTSQVKTHQCKFVRSNYDYVFGSQEAPKSKDYGTIKYKSPDKGLMKVDTVYNLDPQATDPKKKYVKQDVEVGEHWVCDGESIYQYEARTKVLTETKLAPEMRGKAIGEGPLPFLFGAKADTMKERYWIREVTPKNNPTGDYFLEATPRRQQDAANFDRLYVRMAVTKGQLFPKVMHVQNKQGHVLYEFEDHSPNDPIHRVQGFLDSFVRPKTPFGWTKVVEDWEDNRVGDRQAVKPNRNPR